MLKADVNKRVLSENKSKSNSLSPLLRPPPSKDAMEKIPKCFYSLKLLFMFAGFIRCDSHLQSNWIKFYIYFYRIGLLAVPFYVLGIITQHSNPLLLNTDKSQQAIIQISLSLLIIQIYITEIFCIKWFKNKCLSLLYYSLSIDVKSKDNHCFKIITNKLRKSANRITIFVIIILIVSYIQWIFGNIYIRNTISSESESSTVGLDILSIYFIPLLWSWQVWLPLFSLIALLYIVGLILQTKSNILIGRIHASSKRGWKLSSFISQHPYESINSSKLNPFDSWWSLMDSYIKLQTEYNDVSKKWRLYFLITLLTFISQSTVVLILILQGINLYIPAILFAIQFIIIACVMFFVLAQLSKQSNRILKIISMTDFGDNVKQYEVLRFMKLIQINPCTIKIYGVGITYNKAVVIMVTLVSFIGGSLTKFFVDSL